MHACDGLCDCDMRFASLTHKNDPDALMLVDSGTQGQLRYHSLLESNPTFSITISLGSFSKDKLVNSSQELHH